jgi:hypothetical protein
VYRSHGARLAGTASQGDVRFGGMRLLHLGAASAFPIGVDPTGSRIYTYAATRVSVGAAYKAIEYRNIYPGITLRLSFAGRAIKADYLVAPGADPTVIRFRYEGAEARMDGADLVAGELRQPSPTVLQASSTLPARYRIGPDGWVRFEISPHDPQLPLVIDPYVITKSAYFGGGLTDRINAMTLDAAGYIYVTGATESVDFPSGSPQARSGGVEVFVLKINPANLQLIYATYLGGSAEDRAFAIAVDASGSAYIAGFTASTDFPSSNGWGGGATDAFVARFTPSGSLHFSTLIGGSGSDAANGIALKTDGSVWVAGETTSSNIPLVGAAYQSVNRGGQDAFLARVNANGSIAYTGYFGGNGEDRAVGITVDSAGEVYFTGGTTSANFPVANAFQNANQGIQDAFVAKLSADGGTLRYSSYLGGSGGAVGLGEVGNWIGVDATGVATIAGITGSINFPVTPTALQPYFGGGATDAFVAKISAAGNSLLYSTYFGGASTDEAWVGVLSPDGTFYFGGNTASPDMPAVDPIQSQGGDIDGFFAKLSNDLTTMLSFSYLGYTGIDSLRGLAVSSPSIVLAGSSESPAWLPSGGFKGWYDGWIMTVAENALSIQINSNLAGVPFTVSGSGCTPGPAITPATLSWRNGASCSVSFSTGQAVSGGTRMGFQAWSDGGSANPRTFVASSATPSYTMLFSTEHQLLRTVAPAGAGSVSSADGFYLAGSILQLAATTNPGYQFSGWSGAVSGSSNPAAVTMDAPKTVTANFSLLTTIASTTPVPVTISGAGCAPGTYTTPVTLAWNANASCSIAFEAIQGSGDTRWVFTQWTDGSTANPRTVTAAAGATYTLQFVMQHKLTRLVTGQGSVSGADGYYNAGSVLQLNASSTPGYRFTGWSGSIVTSANPMSFTINAPTTMTANFSASPVAVSFSGNIAAQFNVSGTGCPTGSYSTPTTVSWTNGTQCLITATTPQGGASTRYVFLKWADGSTANPRTITASPSAAYTMTFTPEHMLSRTVSGQGSVSGSDGFYAAGSSVQLTATPAAGYLFTGWSASATGTANPLTVVVDAPKTITASFVASAPDVRIDSNTPVAFGVSGSGCPSGAYTAPITLTISSGVTCTLSVQPPAASADTRSIFSRWTDGTTAATRTIVASPGAVYTIVMSTEYRLSRLVSGSGSVSGSDGFYTAGSTVQLAATAGAGYQFAGWSGSATGTANPLSVLMNGPKTIGANFTLGIVAVLIDSNVAAAFSVSGAGCPAGTYTTPAAISWNAGSSCSISAVSPQGGPDTRWVFSRWSDGSTANPRTIVASPGAVYAMVWSTEHRLTRTVAGQGSVSGADGFYAAGSNVSLTATPAAGYHFSGWSGAAGGSSNPLTIPIAGPATITANFALIPSVPDVASLQPLAGSGSNGTFTAVFTHGQGSSQLYLGYILFLPTSNIVSYTARGSCLIEYNRISNGMRLINDPGNGWLGPISGVPLGPNAGTLSNSQCTVNLAGASASLGPNTMTVTVPAFKNTLSPVLGTFLQAADVKDHWTGMTQFGNWTLSNGTPRSGPSITSISSSATAGSSAVYTIGAGHTAGVPALSMIHLLVSDRILGGVPCQAIYFPTNNTLNLINDTGTLLVSNTGVVPGTAGTIANSRCSINTGQAFRTLAGNSVTVTIPMNFQPGTFGGSKNVYVNAFDNYGLLTHWVQGATLTVQ